MDPLDGVPGARARLHELMELGASEVLARQLVMLEFRLSDGDDLVVEEDGELVSERRGDAA